MQIALEVNNSTADQVPSTTTEQTSEVQQTRTSEGLTAPSQPASTSAADQQQLANFLYSESSGTVHTDPTGQGITTGQTFMRFGIGMLIVVAGIALAILCQRYLDKLNRPKKQKRSTSRAKRVR